MAVGIDWASEKISTLKGGFGSWAYIEPMCSKHLAPDPKGLKRLMKRKQKRKSRGVVPTGGITDYQSAHDPRPSLNNKFITGW